MASELDALSQELNELASSLTAKGLENLMTALGVAAKKDMGKAIANDLGGDNQFSGWKRVRLVVGFEHTGPGKITLSPRNNSTGPFQVAEQGRGPSKHGTTRAKYTWSDGVETIEEETPQRALDDLYDTFKRTLGL